MTPEFAPHCNVRHPLLCLYSRSVNAIIWAHTLQQHLAKLCHATVIA